MKHQKSLLIAALLAGLVSQPVLAEEEDAIERSVEYRESIMNIYSWNLKAMGAMVKGEPPYEAEEFNRHVADLKAAVGLDLLAGFPEDSVSDESGAKPEIWLDWDRFKEHYATLQERVAALSTAAAGGDMKQIGPAVGEVGKACKGCHKEFKQ